MFDIASCEKYKYEKLDEEIKIFLQNQRLPERLEFIKNVKTIHDLEVTAKEMDHIIQLRIEKQRLRETGNFSMLNIN